METVDVGNDYANIKNTELIPVYNCSQDNAGGWRNEEITAAIKTELIDTLSEPCRCWVQV